MGHARALLALPDEAAQRRAANEAIARNLSVREIEALARKPDGGRTRASRKAATTPRDVHTRAAEDRLRLMFGTRVRISRRGERGRIEIDFGSEDELIRLFEMLTGNSDLDDSNGGVH
jgi:ParB family chromosome partitioning protein